MSDTLDKILDLCADIGMCSDPTFHDEANQIAKLAREQDKRIAALKTEITEIPTLCRAYEKALREKDKHHDVVIEQLGNRISKLEAELVDFKDSHADEWMKRKELEEDVAIYKKRLEQT